MNDMATPAHIHRRMATVMAVLEMRWADVRDNSVRKPKIGMLPDDHKLSRLVRTLQRAERLRLKL